MSYTFQTTLSVVQLFNFFNNSTQVFTYIGSYVLMCTFNMVVYGQIGEQRVNRSNIDINGNKILICGGLKAMTRKHETQLYKCNRYPGI